MNPHRHHLVLTRLLHCTLPAPCAAISPRVLCLVDGTGYPRCVIRLCPIILIGCLPGELSTPWEESTPLRTAMFSTTEDNSGSRSWTVFLSNRDIPCSLPDTEDPAALLMARSEVYTGLCGDGARHVLLHARRPQGSPNETTYEGSDSLDISVPSVTMRTYAVLAATRAGEEDEPGAWIIEEDLQIGPVGSEGSMEVNRASARDLQAQFSFPIEGISGQFRAHTCEEPHDLFDLVTVTGNLPCPAP